MNDSTRFLPPIFIPYSAERILKAVAVQGRQEEIFAGPAGRNLSLDFKSLIQYNNIIQPFFRSRYETKHYH